MALSGFAMPLSLLTILLVPGALGLAVNVPTNQTVCLSQAVTPGATLASSFAVISGGDLKVRALARADPQGEFYRSDLVSEGSFTLQNAPAKVMICYKNEDTRNEKSVAIYWLETIPVEQEEEEEAATTEETGGAENTVKKGKEGKKETSEKADKASKASKTGKADKAGKTGKTEKKETKKKSNDADDIAKNLRRLYTRTREAAQQQHFAQQSGTVQTTLLTRLAARINFWTVAKCLTVAACAVYQVMVVRKHFGKKRTAV